MKPVILILQKMNEKAYLELIKSNAVEEYVEAHPGMGEARNCSLCSGLKKTYNLDERLFAPSCKVKAVGRSQTGCMIWIMTSAEQGA